MSLRFPLGNLKSLSFNFSIKKWFLILVIISKFVSVDGGWWMVERNATGGWWIGMLFYGIQMNELEK